MILTWVIILLFIFYSFLIIYFWFAWRSIPVFIPNADLPGTKISVIIPARNEESCIRNLLIALQHQTYPESLFETIVIDDHSEDNTAEIVKEFKNVKLLCLGAGPENSYKKKAIETGIAFATGDLIVTTDADCQPPREWLRTLVAFKKEVAAGFVAAPVVIECNSTIVQVFQALDFMMLQGITGAAVYKKKLSMCNGANLAYDKKIFTSVNGFTGIDHIASGDDMLLMYKVMKKYPESVHYLKSEEAIVATGAVKTWKAFFSQRIRWASKARQYEDKRIFPVLLLVYFFNLCFLILLIAGFQDHRYWLYFFILWILKTIVEFPFFIAMAVFFNKQWAIPWFIFFQPLHIFYTIISGLFGQFGKYEWKGRKVR